MTGSQGTVLTGLQQRVDRQVAVVGVIGLGYVRLPQAVAFAEAGFRVLGLDIDSAKARGG